MGDIKLLFCCMGNLCRSPMAEGLFRSLVERAGLSDRIAIESAGTHAESGDYPPDPRAQRVMAARGIDISSQRSRAIARSDFDRFDLILVMDRENYDMLRFTCPRSQAQKIRLLLDFAPKSKIRDVPDPVSGDEGQFVKALELIEAGSRGLLEHIRKNLIPD